VDVNALPSTSCLPSRDSLDLVDNCHHQYFGAKLIQMTAIVLVDVKAFIENPSGIQEICLRRKAIGSRFYKTGICNPNGKGLLRALRV
jgi:hypothetical protein